MTDLLNGVIDLGSIVIDSNTTPENITDAFKETEY